MPVSLTHILLIDTCYSACPFLFFFIDTKYVAQTRYLTPFFYTKTTKKINVTLNLYVYGIVPAWGFLIFAVGVGVRSIKSKNKSENPVLASDRAD